MPKTNVLAKVKKIDIQNKVMGEDWKQHITLTLGEIELTDANLIAIRKFRPHEEVMVNLSTLQLSLGDLEATQRMALLDKDTDATPAPLAEGMIENSLGSSGSRMVTSQEQAESTDYNLDASPVREGSFEGASIETKVFENGEDDVDPRMIVKSFEF